MTSVFDVALAFLDKSGNSKMSSVKLQKLCFYAFGWHAHLTAEPLFDEPFYAMEKGPVVGELLSAHAGRISVTKEMIDTQLSERSELATPQLGPYALAVIDSVWKAYGHLSEWTLVQKTHQEDLWVEAWETRRQGSKRGDLPHSDVIAFFLGRTPRKAEALDLPWPLVSVISEHDKERVDATVSAHDIFIDQLRSFVAS